MIFDDRIELRMNLGAPEETISFEVNPSIAKNTSINGKSPIKNDEALTAQALGSSGCPKWLPVHPQNPNFFITIYAGLNNSKTGDRWSLVI